MKTRRPGLAKRAPRPAPFVQAELHALMRSAPVVAKVPTLRERFNAWVRSKAARFMSFGLRRGKA